jgi:hypothetical protein
MRLLIVGEAPSSSRGEALSGRSGQRLAELMGLTLPEYLAAFERVNLLDDCQERFGKGMAFPLLPAMGRAFELQAGPWTHYLLCGKRVGAAFGFDPVRVRYLRWYLHAGRRYGIIPHPSGIVRWYNDPANLARARRWLRRLGRSASTPRELPSTA